jgi:hypothetical protein
MVKYIPDRLKPTEINVRTYTGDGSTSTFVISASLSTNKILVSLNGILQRQSTHYTVVGSNLQFGSAPEYSDTITIIELPI